MEKIPNHKSKTASIPLILHQTWKDKNLPDTFVKYARSWKKHHPGWDYRFYTDADCKNFIHRTCPDWMDIYEGFTHPIQRADLFRYLVVYHCGGLYADMDMACFKPVDSIMSKSRCLICVEALLTKTYQKKLGYPEPFQVANCIFAAEKNHGFLSEVLERIKSIRATPVMEDMDIEDTTGPRMLTRLYFTLTPDMKEQLTLMPQIYFMSPHIYPNLFPFNVNMYARHHCVGTWKKDKERKLFRRRWIERNRLPGFF
jgi:mannosyltransferase OCH1-like enzyme